jgi:hypothetical protein
MEQAARSQRVSRANLAPSVLWRNRQTAAHLVLRPKPRNRRGDFEAQINKPKLPVLRPKPGNPPPPWFWGSTKKPTNGFEAKPGETVATSFEARPGETVATSFKAKLEKTVATGFKAKPAKTITVGFKAKPLETVATDFEAKPTKPLPPILRPNQWKPSESLYFTPHLPPAHHETSKHDSPNEQR